MNVQTQQKQGFTIIEVVLVLAIAALIFLMVFLAFPALQRNQKDQQRRTDIGRFVSQMSQYETNTSGSVPANQNALNTFVSSYLRSGGDTFKDPDSGNDYTVSLATPTNPALGTIYYMNNAKCNSAGNGFVSGAGSRKIAVLTKLQSSGTYCQSN